MTAYLLLHLGGLECQQFALFHEGATMADEVHARQLRIERQKRYRQRLAKQKPKLLDPDQALETAIMRRGRELTEMMRTPLCMWPSEWKEK